MEKQITFTNHGQQLVGMIHLPKTDARAPAVLMCHGFMGDRIESHFIFVKMARRLANAGYIVMRFDFRGSGESEGEFSDVTIPAEVDDARVALAWLRGQPEVDPKRVSLLGLSLGGAIAATLAGEDGNIAALVLWSALAEPSVFVAQGIAQADSHPAPLGVQPSSSFDLGGHLVGEGFRKTAGDVKPLESIRNYVGNLLILHGTRDEVIPPSEAERYQQALGKEHASLHWIEGADHTYSADMWEKEVFDLTVNWLDRQTAP